MNEKKKQQRTLADEIPDKDKLFTFVRLTAEGNSLSEIGDKIEGWTKGKAAGHRFRNRQELETLVTAYIVQFGPVPKTGNSRSTIASTFRKKPEPERVQSDTEELDRIIAVGLEEWTKRSSSFRPFAFAAMQVNSKAQARRIDALGVEHRVGNVRSYLEKHLGIGESEAKKMAAIINAAS